jgi:hypothetical protein
MPWITNIQDPTIKKIFALSDIHADIHVLIITLRDCAKVIRKKTGFNYDEIDHDLERLLNLNLNDNNDKKEYIEDLNYEWCGGSDTHVVICGDILDGSRPDSTYTENKIVYNEISPNKNCNLPNNICEINEYWQIEVKILWFISTINAQAMNYVRDMHYAYNEANNLEIPYININRIHKVLGNHEIGNITSIPNFIENYAHKETLMLPNYLHGYTRREYFNYGNPGYYNLLQDGTGILLKINNNIFVHGQLDHEKTYTEYEKMNDDINSDNNDDNLTFIPLKPYNNFNKVLWGRLYDRMNSKRKNNLLQRTHCQSIEIYLETLFLPFIPDNIYTSNDMRIIVGHCPQSWYVDDNYINSTFSNITNNGNIQILSGSVVSAPGNNSHNIVFGIGMECDKVTYDYEPHKNINNDSRFVYKVDVGSSRAFDKIQYRNGQLISSTLHPSRNENITIGLSPQTLLIDSESNKLSIIRSTPRNTRIHMPREYYENLINDDDKNIDRRLDNPTYNPYIVDDISPTHCKSSKSTYNKYLKYKKKYMILKKNQYK